MDKLLFLPLVNISPATDPTFLAKQPPLADKFFLINFASISAFFLGGGA